MGTLREVHNYLSLWYVLLDRVIRARNLHHSRFYPMRLDYGHELYINELSSRRVIVVEVLERLERRVADVAYQNQRWLTWARECQDEEDAAQEDKKKLVQKEVALFKKQMKNVQSRMRELKAKEDFKRQEEHLNETYYKNIRGREPEELEAT